VRLRWLARKELAWARRNAVVLLFVLVLLPGGAAYSVLGFQTVLPTDTPVGVVAQNDSVSDGDLSIAEASMTTFSDPIRYESREGALADLERERVYAVLTVPPDLTDDARGTANFTLYTDGDMVPYREPSFAVAGVTQVSLGTILDRDVDVTRQELGAELTLPEYLVPTFLMMLTMLLAFTYLPYALVREARALDRIRVASSIEAAVGAKLVSFALLAVVPLAAAQGAAAVLEFRVAALAPGALLVYPLTFLYLGAVASAITVLSRFEAWGRLVNAAFMLLLFTFSGLVYPVGFFSVNRREFTRLLPTHYSMIAARGHVIKDMDVAAMPESYGVMVATAVVSLVALKLSAVHYERGT
jgi:ABC-2 type transport system permease protein